ncbi:CotH kinase family protein [Archangium primigenium]|uniref:CotH kinase family protein n=1 Tax=[Archangium] primigenium TaxID=2792470 RepID=UPI001957FDAF|nr:CotH kinase family protein [Archangium primigenium]MBM7111944.1 CotH kinase family protein [Archangium primigenium]
MRGGGALKGWALVGGVCWGLVGCGPTAGPEASVPSVDVEEPASGTPPTPGPGEDGTQAPPAPGESAPGEPSPQPPRPARCAPTGTRAYWLQEGESVTATVRCGTGYTSPDLRFSVASLPSGASFDEATGTLTWTTTRGQADVWRLPITEKSTGETGELRVGVAVQLSNPGGVQTLLRPETYTEEYGLPVFHLSFEGTLTAGGYRPVQLVYRGHRYTLEAKYRGATSSVFPKRNYTFKFPKGDRFTEPEKAGGAFRDMQRLVLISPFNDNSYLRPRLAFDLWNRMSPDHVQIQTYSAVMYVNGRFWGLFTVADHVDDDLMGRHGLSKDGDLFKAVDADANFSASTKAGAAKSSLAQGYEKKEGTPKDGQAGAYNTISALTQSIAQADTDTFFARRAEWLHTADYEDWWIFNTAILGTDSAAKNAYHYYDPATRAPWRFIPWDLDASFGQLWDTRRIGATGRPDFSSDNLIFSRLLADPRIATPLRARYQALLRGAWSKAEVLALIDGYAEELRQVGPRDEARWRKQYLEFERWGDRTDFTTHAEEVAYLRQWVSDRWDTLEQRVP